MSVTPTRKIVLLVTAMAVTIGLAGCLPLGGGTITATRLAPSPSASDPGTEGAGAVDPAMLQEIDDAVEVVNAYWTAHWNDFYTGDYVPPTIVGMYDGEDPLDPVTCSGNKPEAFNAFYCGDDDTIIWDKNLMQLMWEQGDSLMYLIIAHEWGHAVQARLDESEVWSAKELQADCYAGAALWGATADELVTMEEGDKAEIANGLVAIADETPWTASGDHGDPFDRIQAFTEGKNGGVVACYPQD